MSSNTGNIPNSSNKIAHQYFVKRKINVIPTFICNQSIYVVRNIYIINDSTKIYVIIVYLHICGLSRKIF